MPLDMSGYGEKITESVILSQYGNRNYFRLAKPVSFCSNRVFATRGKWMQREKRFRASCFGRPVGPWRARIEMARSDLIGAKLGEYDERGRFYVTVPGELQIAPIDFGWRTRNVSRCSLPPSQVC